MDKRDDVAEQLEMDRYRNKTPVYYVQVNTEYPYGMNWVNVTFRYKFYSKSEAIERMSSLIEDAANDFKDERIRMMSWRKYRIETVME